MPWDLRLGSWSAGCREAIDLLALPMECQVCGSDRQVAPVCQDCRREISSAAGPACPRCALPLGPWVGAEDGCSWCRGRSLGFDRALALGPYQGPIRSLALRLKREGNAWLAPWLADLLIDKHRAALQSSRPTRVVPVPLHWRRHWRRGFNQADALATRLASRLELKLERPLRRIRDTKTLAQLSRTERARAMKGAFRPRKRADLSGQTILLIDDVLTTGATCGAAARALKNAGAERVIAVVLGRAE